MNKLIVTTLTGIVTLALAGTSAQAANDHYKCFKLKDAKMDLTATEDAAKGFAAGTRR